MEEEARTMETSKNKSSGSGRDEEKREGA